MAYHSRRQALKGMGGAGIAATTFGLAGCLDNLGFGGGDFPSEDVRHIIPWDAGGGTDTVMRQYVNFAEGHLDVDIFSENHAGASTGVGMSRIREAEPDGHTIGTATWDSYVTVPYFQEVEDFEFLEDLYVLNTVTVHPIMLVLNEDQPWDTLDELVDYAADNPGDVDLAHAGENGILHLPGLDLERQSDAEFNYVGYAGGGAVNEAVATAEVNGAVATVGMALQVEESLKMLGVMSDERFEQFPDVPTFPELGYDVTWGSSRHILLPTGVDQDRIDVLNEAFEAGAMEDEFQTWVEEDGGGGFNYMDHDEAVEFIENSQEAAFAVLDELIG